MNKIIVVVALLVSMVAGAGVYMWWQSLNAQQAALEANPKSTIERHDGYRLFKPAKALNPFSLETGNGAYDQQQLQGQWTFVIFGYTHCPDVCPTTLTRVKAVYKQLKSSADAQIVFVSADPLRDDPQRLSKYVGYFDSEFVGATTSHDKLFPFAQNLYLPYGIIAQKKSENYEVSHSASIALINPQGKLHAQFMPGHQVGEVPVVDMKKMAASFAKLVKSYQVGG